MQRLLPLQYSLAVLELDMIAGIFANYGGKKMGFIRRRSLGKVNPCEIAHWGPIFGGFDVQQ
jgi:hypothetical protein